MNTTVYFVKDSKIVGIGQGFVAWDLINAHSLMENMKKGLQSAKDFYKSLNRSKWSQCDLAWKDVMSKWYASEEEFHTFEYAIVMDYKIPSEWFQEMKRGTLTVEDLNQRKNNGLLNLMPSEDIKKLFDRQ
jgi:hypothetical protein